MELKYEIDMGFRERGKISVREKQSGFNLRKDTEGGK